MLVHYVGWADQPYVRIHCTNTDCYVGFDQDGLPPGVYRCDNLKKSDTLYTFDKNKVTCPLCSTQEH